MEWILSLFLAFLVLCAPGSTEDFAQNVTQKAFSSTLTPPKVETTTLSPDNHSSSTPISTISSQMLNVSSTTNSTSNHNNITSSLLKSTLPSTILDGVITTESPSKVENVSLLSNNKNEWSTMEHVSISTTTTTTTPPLPSESETSPGTTTSQVHHHGKKELEDDDFPITSKTTDDTSSTYRSISTIINHQIVDEPIPKSMDNNITLIKAPTSKSSLLAGLIFGSLLSLALGFLIYKRLDSARRRREYRRMNDYLIDGMYNDM